MGRVLVVEDDGDLRVLLAHALEHAGHSTVITGSGKSGLQLARTTGPDLVILDWMLPDLPGSTLAEAMRSDARTQQIPFIFVSARSSEADRVHGLELGAEDYVTKPFSVRELLLRVQVALRRSSVPPEADGGPLRVGALSIDSANRRADLAGEDLELTPLEFKLLAALAGRRGRVQSREALLADVWGVHPGLETRTVDMHVRRLREKLKHAAGLIETVRGVGYRMRDADWDDECRS